MAAQIIVSPSGERLVVVPEDDYNRLVEIAEDTSDAAVAVDFQARLARGEEEMIPAEVVDRLLAGEGPVRVFREYRGLARKDLAAAAGIAVPYLAQIEAGTRDGTVATMKKLAEALKVTIDDLV